MLDGAAALEVVAALDGVAVLLVADEDDGLADAAGAAADPLIAEANAIRSARAAVSLALVSASRLTAAVAFEALVPDVPVGRASVAVVAPPVPVAAESVNSSPNTLSAAAASLAHFVLLAPAVASLPTIFCSVLMWRFSSAICAFAGPLTAPAGMLFTAASAFCRCSCGVPCAAVLWLGAALVVGAAVVCGVCAAAGTARKPATRSAAQVEVQRFIFAPF